MQKEFYQHLFKPTIKIFKMEDFSNYFTQKVNPDVLHLINSGINYYQQQELENSLASFNQAIVLMPENANLYTFRGNVYQDLGDNALAEKDFRKTIELRPNDSHANFRLGIMYSQKNDFENAVKFLEISYRNSFGANLDLIGFGTNNLLVVSRQVICNNLGNFLGQLKRYDEAIKYLKEAIEIEPKYANPHIALGIILLQIGKVNEGITYIEKADKLGIPQAKVILQMLNK